MRQLPRWPLLLPLAAVVLLILAPLARLAVQGWSGVGAVGAGGVGGEPLPSLTLLWQDDYLRWRVLWSVLQATLTCGAALLMGVPLAWVLARFEFWGRELTLRLLMLPFVVPTLVAALGVLALLGPRGLLSGLLGLDLQGTPWLLIYGNLFFNLCLVVRAGVEALGQVNARQVAVARTLGASPWRAFWRVEWPTIAPWLASSLCLVFLYCFSGFGLALVLGGQRYATAEVEIYTLVAHELKLAEASLLALTMLVVTGGVALGYARLEKRLAAPARVEPMARRRPQGLWQWLGLGTALFTLFLICLAPLAAIVGRALWAGPEAWLVLAERETLLALWNTLRFSAMALVMATVLGLAHALTAHASVAWRAAAYLPFVVSPVTVAFGLLLLYPQWTASLGLLLAAYALLAYPFVASSLAAGLDRLPAQLQQAARTLGAGPWRTLWRVTLPLLRPALRRGMAFAAATALGEFAVTLFLSRPEWATLTTLMYERMGRPGTANLDAALVLASGLMALALMAFLLIEWPAHRNQPADSVASGGGRHA